MNVSAKYQFFKETPITNLQRPPVSQRTFKNELIEQVIREISSTIKSKNLKLMFEKAFPNTLDTTIDHTPATAGGQPDTFILTGDVKAMWARDSMNQILPYLQFINQDDDLKSLIKGLIHRQGKNIRIDSYANAFNKDPDSYQFPYPAKSYRVFEEDGKKVYVDVYDKSTHDKYPQNKYITERKFETDTLSALLKLSHRFYETTSDSSFIDDDWIDSVKLVMKMYKNCTKGTFEELAELAEEGYDLPSYTFWAYTGNTLVTLLNGYGEPSQRIGLVKQHFRPSDDRTLLQYNIPGNALIVVSLQRVSKMLKEINKSDELNELAKEMEEFAETVKQAIYKHGVKNDEEGNPYFLYEVDGYGNTYFMDDPNVPSLLSLPYLEFCDKDDPIYVNTRKKLLDKTKNPYYYSGKYGKGFGTPHNQYNDIWPIGTLIQIITTSDPNEIKQCLKDILTTESGSRFLHECYNAGNTMNYHRPWFAWANSLFGETMVYIYDNFPQILSEFDDMADEETATLIQDKLNQFQRKFE